MSSSSSGDQSLSHTLLKQAKDAARSLARLRTSTDPSRLSSSTTPARYPSNEERAIEITKQRRIVRELFAQLIKDHHAHAEANEAEADLWRHAFYTDIDLLRKRIAKLRTDREAGLELAATERELREFIDDAKIFYSQLLSVHLAQARITSTSSSFRDQLVVSSRRRRGNGRSDSGSSALVAALAAVDGSATAAMLRSLFTSYRALIFLGDLERYMQQSLGAAGRAERAEQQYRLALQLIPENGHAHNQLAVMASASAQLLPTSWRYIRAIAVRGQPFTQAVTNLESVIESNEKKTRSTFQPLTTITGRAATISSTQSEQLAVFVYGLLYHQHTDVTLISMITDVIHTHLPKWLGERTVSDGLNWLMALIYFFHTTLLPATDKRKAAVAPVKSAAAAPVAAAATAADPSSSSSSSSPAVTPAAPVWLVPANYTTFRATLPEITQRSHIAVSIWMAQLMSRVMRYENMARSLPIVGCFFDWLRINPQLLVITREMTDAERISWQQLWQDTALLLTRLQAMIHLHDPTLINSNGTGCEWPIPGMPLLDEEVELRGFAYMTDAYPSSASRFDFAERRSGRISMVEAAARPTRARGDRKERPQADDALRRHKLLQFGLQQGMPELLRYDPGSGVWWCTWQAVPAAVAEARASGLLFNHHQQQQQQMLHHHNNGININSHHHHSGMNSAASSLGSSYGSSGVMSPRSANSSGASSANASPFASPGGTLSSRRTISGSGAPVGRSPPMSRTSSGGGRDLRDHRHHGGSNNDLYNATGHSSPPNNNNRRRAPGSGPNSYNSGSGHNSVMDTENDMRVSILRAPNRDLSSSMMYQHQQQQQHSGHGHHNQQPHHSNTHSMRDDAVLTLLASAAHQGSAVSSTPPSWLAHEKPASGTTHPGHMSAHNSHGSVGYGGHSPHTSSHHISSSSHGGHRDQRDPRDDRHHSSGHASSSHHHHGSAHHHGGHGQHSPASAAAFEYETKGSGRMPSSSAPAWSHHSGGSSHGGGGGGQQAMDVHDDMDGMLADEQRLRRGMGGHIPSGRPATFDSMASAAVAMATRSVGQGTGGATIQPSLAAPIVPSQALMSVQAAVAAATAEQVSLRAPSSSPTSSSSAAAAASLSAIAPSALSAMFAAPVPLDSPYASMVAGIAPSAAELASMPPPQEQAPPDVAERLLVHSLENQFDSLLDDEERPAPVLPRSAIASPNSSPPTSNRPVVPPTSALSAMMATSVRRGHSPAAGSGVGHHLQHVPLRPSSTSPPLPLTSPLMRTLHSGSPVGGVPPQHHGGGGGGGGERRGTPHDSSGSMNMITEDDRASARRTDSPLEGWTPFGRSALPATGAAAVASVVAVAPAPRAPNASWTTSNLFSATPRADIIDRGASPSPQTVAEAHRMAGRMSDLYTRNFFTTDSSSSSQAPASGSSGSSSSLAPHQQSRPGSGHTPPQRISPPQSFINSAVSPRHASMLDTRTSGGNIDEEFHRGTGSGSLPPSRGSTSPALTSRTPPPASALSASAAPWSLQYNTASFGGYQMNAPSPRHSTGGNNNNNMNNSSGHRDNYSTPVAATYQPRGESYGGGMSGTGGASPSPSSHSHYISGSSRSGSSSNARSYDDFTNSLANNNGNVSFLGGNYSGMITAPKASTSPPVVMRSGVYHAPTSMNYPAPRVAPSKQHNDGSGHI